MDEFPSSAEEKHLIGTFDGQRRGPSLICAAGIHGNEPAGVEALKRVLDTLQVHPRSFSGKLVALLGNTEAFSQGHRYVEKDLNRMWEKDRIAQLTARNAEDLKHEDREQFELLKVLKSATRGNPGDVYFMDLHTSSADGPPFGVLNDSLHSRSFVRTFPLPLVLGFEEELRGTLADYMDSLGHVSAGLEAGQHTSSLAIDYLESLIWIALVSAGNLSQEQVPGIQDHYRRLADSCSHLPSFIEVRYRHPVKQEDEFVMRPGYQSFQQVEAGQLLAQDRQGDLTAPGKAFLLLPLYQKEGDDGFFLAAAVRPFWIQLSAWIRPLRLDLFLHWLPGVHRHPEEEGALLVNARIARWYTLDLFHLLGFRRRPSKGARLVMVLRKG
jgi:succinylglutamate desuccinylase